MFLFIRSITASGLFQWPLLKASFKMWVSRGPVPGARVAANPRLLSCKYHTLRNVGRKEDLEGPMQVCNKSPGPAPLRVWQMTRWFWTACHWVMCEPNRIHNVQFICYICGQIKLITISAAEGCSVSPPTFESVWHEMQENLLIHQCWLYG